MRSFLLKIFSIMTDIIFRLIARIILRISPIGRFPKWNQLVFRLLGVKAGVNTKIYSNVRVARKLKVTVGCHTFIGNRTTFSGGAGSSIKIGDYCDISDNVHFVTGSHEIDNSGIRSAGLGYTKNIVVENGAWIGYNALILPGITIGKGAIIGAGTVVHKDVQPRTIVAGNPMRIIRQI
jgi:acetyltransferase-like isoleucine patch superfamily enzyme